MIKKTLLPLFFGIASLSVVQAQFDYNAILPPSPTAAALGRYGETPISFYTGTPNISIPLASIKGSELELPISLSYMAHGVKVEDNASWVGTGWSLNCTGVITRTVQGLDDGTKPRVAFPLPTDTTLMKNLLVDIQGKNVDPEPDLYTFNFPGYSGSFVLDAAGEAVIEDAKALRIKRDPVNIYKFTITTENGTQYIFDRAENTTFYGATSPAGISALYLSKIISSTGKEVIDFTYSSEVTKYYSLSRPTKFVRPLGTPTVFGTTTFGIHIINSLRLTSITTNFGSNIQFIPDDAHPRQDLSVVAPEVTPLPLKQIKFFDSNNVSKKFFAFEYETIQTSIPYTQLAGTDPPADQYTAYANYRLYLKSVKEVSGDQSKDNPPYIFTYSGRDSQNKDLLPNKLSADQDHWGYFNAAGNLNLWPGYKGPFGFFDPEFSLITIHPGNIACPDIAMLVSRAEFTITGAKRDPKAPFMQYGTLSSIAYPTGGKTIFEFEPHKYTYEANNGEPVKKTVETGVQAYLSGSGSELVNTVTKQAHQGAKFIFEFNVTCWDPNTHAPLACSAPGAQVNFDKFQGNSVALLNSNGQEIIAAKWVPGDGGFWIYRNGLVDNTIGMLHPDASGFITRQIEDFYLIHDTYTLKATKDPDGDTDVFGWLYVEEQAFIDINDQNEALLGGGIRIKKIESYDQNNALVSQKTYDYGVGVLLEGPRYSIYTWKSPLSTPQIFQPCPLNAQDQVDSYPYLLISCGSHSALGYTQGSSIGYANVTEKFSNGSLSNGSVEYEYTTGMDYADNDQPWSNTIDYLFWDQSPSIGKVWQHIYWENHKVVWPYISQDNLDRKRGFLLKSTFKNSLGQEVLVKENQPTMVDIGTISGVRCQVFRPDLDWMYSVYKYSYGYVNVASSLEHQIHQPSTTSITKSTVYTYGSTHHHFLTKQDVTDSDGATLSTEYHYPADYENITDPNHVITQMKPENLHMIGTPVETRTYKNGNIIGGSVNVMAKYNKQFGGFFVAPASFYKMKEGIANPSTPWLSDPTNPDLAIFTKEIAFDFNGQANLSKVVPKDQVNLSFFWETNIPYPLAKATNAQPDQLFFSSFENIAGTLQDQSHPAKTGNRYLNLGSFNFSLNGGFNPPNPAGLKMSYWYWLTDHWEFSGEVNFTNALSSPGTRLDEIRVYPDGSQMTTYTIDQMIGITSQTDANNLTSYYEYDEFGRLKLLRDKDQNIVQSYQYHYKGQQ